MIGFVHLRISCVNEILFTFVVVTLVVKNQDSQWCSIKVMRLISVQLSNY